MVMVNSTISRRQQQHIGDVMQQLAARLELNAKKFDIQMLRRSWSKGIVPPDEACEFAIGRSSPTMAKLSIVAPRKGQGDRCRATL